MNPSYREREVSHQLGDTEAGAVIVQDDLVSLVHTVRGALPRLARQKTAGVPGDRSGRYHV